jgi:hypothetical protein
MANRSLWLSVLFACLSPSELLAVCLVLLPSITLAQSSAVPARQAGMASQPKLPNRTLDLTHVESLPGLPASTPGSEICSSDGTTFAEIYAVGKPETAWFPEIYSISDQREIKKLSFPTPTGYKYVLLQSFFPSEHQLVALIQADQPTTSDGSPQQKGLVSFLSTMDRDGDRKSIVKLDLPFEPAKAAILESGEFLIFGSDRANFNPVLALVHEDGSLDRMLDLDTRPYGLSEDLGKIYGRKATDSNTFALQRLTQGSLSAAQFVPWGSEILLLQPGSKLPVYRINQAGLQGAVTIKFPDGFLLDSILGSSEKDSWAVLTKDPSSFQKMAKDHVVENPTQHLFEVNPHTGEVIDQLSVKGPHPGEVSCAANGKVSGIYYGSPLQANAHEQLTYASAPR